MWKLWFRIIATEMVRDAIVSQGVGGLLVASLVY